MSSETLQQRLGITLPVIQAPMAGSNGSALVIGVCRTGGLGSLPCAMLTAEVAEAEIQVIRENTDGPFNLNFFCHQPPDASNEDIARWRKLVKPYFQELGIEQPTGVSAPSRQPFGEEMCQLVEQTRPAVVSFHFGLPPDPLLDRVKAAGPVVLCSATTVEEAIWLEAKGVDAIIAQGVEAGGHRGMFLGKEIHTQSATLSLVPQIGEVVSVPVIAAGGISSGAGIAAALALGAECVQIGTAYLFAREALTSAIHRKALMDAGEGETALTNLLSGRPARGITNRVMREIGPMNQDAAPFPLCLNEMGLLKAASEKKQRDDFSSLWSGQASTLAKEFNGQSAEEITIRLVRDAGISKPHHE